MGIELALDSGNADMCVQPRARGAQLRRSQPAFIIVMVMKLVSVAIVCLESIVHIVCIVYLVYIVFFRLYIIFPIVQSLLLHCNSI